MMRELPIQLAGLLCIWLACGCGDTQSDEGSLQSVCVAEILGIERTFADGEGCYNIGYSDCYGFASECIGYCAFDICQPAPCVESSDCEVFGSLPATSAWACSDYVVSGALVWKLVRSRGGLSRGIAWLPMWPGETCGSDPFGPGDMVCVDGSCESTCPSACISGSVCCGGSLCSGDCIGTPCC